MDFHIACRECGHTWVQTEKPLPDVKCPKCDRVFVVAGELFTRDELMKASDALFEWVHSQDLSRVDAINLLFGSMMRVACSMIQERPEVLPSLHEFLILETNRIFDAWKAQFDAGRH